MSNSSLAFFVISLHVIFFPHLQSNNHKSTQTCLYSCFRSNQMLKVGNNNTSRNHKMKTRLDSPLVAPVEAPSALRFRRCMIVIFFLTQGSFCKLLAHNLMRYCIYSPYYSLYVWFKRPWHTYRGFGFVFLKLGVISGIWAILTAGRMPS
jgi:hypothetical protein